MGGAPVSAPVVSVIVPTRNRAASLRRLLDAIASQSLADFELIVVDDGSSDTTPSVLCELSDARVRSLRTEGVGAVQARCIGVADATGQILAFTDDDCVPDADWLRRGVDAITAGADVVQGRTEPERPATALERTLSHSATDGLFPTCNVFYRRSAYDRQGGFDRFAKDRLGFRPDDRARRLGFGEDTLLGWAVARAGTAAAAPEALVRHEVVRPPLADLFSRAWMAGAFPRLVREVPELRETLVTKRFVLGRADARLGVYGTAVALLASTPLGIAAAAWWVLARARRIRSRPGALTDRVAGLPVQLALDVTTSVALVIGSVRARTPLL